MADEGMVREADEIMTLRQVMERLGVSRPTVANLVRRGLLTRHVATIAGPRGERTYYLRSEVERLAGEDAFRRRRRVKDE